MEFRLRAGEQARLGRAQAKKVDLKVNFLIAGRRFLPLFEEAGREVLGLF